MLESLARQVLCGNKGLSTEVRNGENSKESKRMRTQRILSLAVALTFALGLMCQPGFCNWGQTDTPKTDEPTLRPAVTNTTTTTTTATDTTVIHTESTKTQTKTKFTLEKIRRDKWIAWRMAKDPWIDRACLADPGLPEAICAHPGPAALLAKHPHVADIAQADPYLCRRLTQWKKATMNLVKNPHCMPVITRDPEGMYRAIAKRPKIGRILSKHPMFNQMIVENPDLGRFITGHM